MPVSDYEGLFSIISNKFGGDGYTIFALPNLSQKSPLEGQNYQICIEGIEPAGDPNPPADELQYYSTNIYSNLFIGEIVLVKGFNEEASDAFFPCHGGLLSISQNTALFSLIGNRFGGNGYTTFGLPDLSSIASPVEGAQYYMVRKGIFPSRW